MKHRFGFFICMFWEMRAYCESMCSEGTMANAEQFHGNERFNVILVHFKVLETHD